MSTIIVFLSQFLTVFMLGFQSLMVRDHNYIGAIIGSFIIGICQLLIFNSINSLVFGSSNWYGFIVAGPIAIASAMWLHTKVLKLIKGNKFER